MLTISGHNKFKRFSWGLTYICESGATFSECFLPFGSHPSKIKFCVKLECHQVLCYDLWESNMQRIYFLKESQSCKCCHKLCTPIFFFMIDFLKWVIENSTRCSTLVTYWMIVSSKNWNYQRFCKSLQLISYRPNIPFFIVLTLDPKFEQDIWQKLYNSRKLSYC